MMKTLRRVEVMRPPKMTFAIGDCNSLPGRSPVRAIGMRANALVRAVMRMGLRRSTLPVRILSIKL